jgi:hypothetical protein
MNALEYREHIEKLGLSQNAASRFLGVSERSSRRYAQLDHKGRPDNIPIPAAIDMLLRLMVKNKISVEAACKLAGIDPQEEVFR